MSSTPSRYATVPVKSRATYPVTYQFDGDPFTWAPGGTLHLTMEAAAHCIKSSRIRWDPMMQQHTYVLYELKDGIVEPSSLSWDEGHPTEALDRSHMPATHFDDNGNPIPPEMKVLNLGDPVGMMRGRIPLGGNLGPGGVVLKERDDAGNIVNEAAPALLGRLSDEQKAGLHAAHEALAEAAANDPAL